MESKPLKYHCDECGKDHRWFIHSCVPKTENSLFDRIDRLEKAVKILIERDIRIREALKKYNIFDSLSEVWENPYDDWWDEIPIDE